MTHPINSDLPLILILGAHGIGKTNLAVTLSDALTSVDYKILIDDPSLPNDEALDQLRETLVSQSEIMAARSRDCPLGIKVADLAEAREILRMLTNQRGGET